MEKESQRLFTSKIKTNIELFGKERITNSCLYSSSPAVGFIQLCNNNIRSFSFFSHMVLSQRIYLTAHRGSCTALNPSETMSREMLVLFSL